MTQIHSTLPLPTEHLRQVITSPESSVVINYAESKIKNRAALIFITNANLTNVAFDMTGTPREDVYALIDAYITQKTTISIPGLVASVAHLLLAYKCVPMHPVDMQEVLSYSMLTNDDLIPYLENDERALRLEHLCEVMENVLLYAVSCSAGFDAAGGLPEDVIKINDVDYTGCTFVNLFALEWFMFAFYSMPPRDETKLKYFTQQYDEYLYNNENLFAHVSRTFLLPAMQMYMSDPTQVAALKSALLETSKLDE